MEKYIVYANLKNVANYLINNKKNFKFETEYIKDLIEFEASKEFVEDMKKSLKEFDKVVPKFYN